MEPNQPIEQPAQLPPTPPQPVSPTTPIVTPPPTPSKLPTILFTIVSLLSLLGLIYFYLQTQSLKKQITMQPSPTPTPSIESTIQPSPTTNPTTNWQTYQIEELGISFRYPPTVQPLDYPNGLETNGETGKQLCLSFVPFTTSFKLVKSVHAGSGACQGILAIGSTSTDYQAGREGGFGDIQGYEKMGNSYKANFVLGKQYDLPPNLVSETTITQGLTILKIQGQNATQFSEHGPVPIPGTPGEGYLGAIINIKYAPYSGFNIQMKLSDTLTKQVFDQILSTLQFTNAQ